MKIFTLICVTLLCIPQDDFIPNSFRQYEMIINEAELKICNNEYKSALYIYKKAFKKGYPLFASDLLNASICSLLSDKGRIDKTIFKYLKHFQSVGYSIKNDSLIWKLCTNDTKASLIKSCLVFRDTSITDREFIRSIDAIMGLDQGIRHYCGGYRKTCLDTIIFTDKKNMVTLGKILNIQQVKNKIDHEIFESKTTELLTVARHARMWGDTSLDEKLYQLLVANYIKPLAYGFLMDYRSNNSEVNNKYLNQMKRYGIEMKYTRINDTLLTFKIPDSLLTVIDRNREEIGMDKTNSDYYKYRYLLNQKLFKVENFAISGFKLRMGNDEATKLISEWKQKNLLE